MTGSEPTLREAVYGEVAQFVGGMLRTEDAYGPDYYGALNEVMGFLASRSPALPPAAPETTLREALVEAVADWRTTQHSASGSKEADEGYAVGLGRAIFAVEEILALAAPETWTCPTCHTPMPADAAVGHLRGEHPIDPDYEFAYGQPLCASCGHPHTDAAWVDTDPDDGTCWSAGSLVCGCPKFITPAVKRLRAARRLRADAAASGSGDS